MANVVVIEPGDVLLIGNVGRHEGTLTQLLVSLKGLEDIGIPTVVFRNSIEVHKLDPATVGRRVDGALARVAAAASVE